MTFGKQLREHAEARGITQVELAKVLGITQIRVGQIYASKNLTERVVRQVAEAIGLKALVI